MWLQDKYWVRAAEFLLSKGLNYSVVFAPAEFNHLSDNCLPIAFAHMFAHQMRGLLLIPKDDVDILPLEWIKNINRTRLLYADEVFVALDCEELDYSNNNHSDHEHLPYLLERTERIQDNKCVRRYEIDVRLSTLIGNEPYALIAAASMTGNSGDRLLCAACVKFLKGVWPDLSCVVTDGNMDRQLIKNASVVIVGPGGRLYDIESSGKRIDLQNLANYFKVGYLAQEYDKPFFVLGVGHQELVSRIGWQFVRGSLKSARLVVTRDHNTASLLTNYIECPIQNAPDMSVIFSHEIARLASRQQNERKIVALCGSFLHDSDLPLIMSDVFRIIDDFDLRFVIQANEDAETISRHEQSLRETFRDRFVIEDHRNSDPINFIESIATADVVITNRFHAMKIAMMAGTNLLVFYSPGDKGIA